MPNRIHSRSAHLARLARATRFAMSEKNATMTHLKQRRAKIEADAAEIDREVAAEEDTLDAEIAANQDALEASGHWGVPTLVFEGEPFFGQDRIEMARWRMEQQGLAKR